MSTLVSGFGLGLGWIARRQFAWIFLLIAAGGSTTIDPYADADLVSPRADVAASPADTTLLPPGWLVRAEGAATWTITFAWNSPYICFTVLNTGETAPAFQDINLSVFNATLSTIHGTGPAGQPLAAGFGSCYQNSPNSKGCYAPGGGSGTTIQVCAGLTNVGPTTYVEGQANISTGGLPTPVASATWHYSTSVDLTILKFEDMNGNGIRETGDNPWPGQSLFLDENANAVFDPGEPNGVSGSNGLINIPGLTHTSGTFNLRETVNSSFYSPTGAVPVDFSNPTAIPAQIPFANFRYGSAGGTFLVDRWAQGPGGPVCPFGQWANEAGTGCEDCPVGPDGDACRAVPTGGMVIPAPGCTNCSPGWFTGVPVLVSGTNWTAGSLPAGEQSLWFPQTAISVPSWVTRSGESHSFPTSFWYQNTTAGGRVFADMDRDGLFGSGDSPISGHPVQLTFPGSSLPPQTIQTDANGSWTAPGLLPNTLFNVSSSTPVGYASLPLSESARAQSGGSFTFDFALQQPFTVTVNKYRDTWGDGLLDAGDVPWTNVPFCIDSNANRQCDPSEPHGSTGPDGQATLPNVPLYGDPLDLIETYDGQTAYPTFPPGGSVAIDFPNLHSNPSPYVFLNAQYGLVSGTVRADRFGRGPLGPGCPFGQWSNAAGTGCEACPSGPGGVFCNNPTSELFLVPAPGCLHCPPAGAPPASTVSNGLFSFPSVVPGQYAPSAANGLFVPSVPIDVPSGTEMVGLSLFGSANSTVGGRVFVDDNANGQFEPGETPVVGTRLVGGPPGLADSFFDVFSGVDGTWNTTTVGPGRTVEYRIILPPAYQTPGPLTGTFISESGGFLDLHVPVHPRTDGTVTAFKFVDFDGDGALDSFEPGLNGVTFRLTGPTGAQTDLVSSDRAPGEPGYAVFTGLGPGTYTLSEVAPAGFMPTVPASGSYSIAITAGVPNEALHLFGNAPIALDYGDALQTADPSHVQFPWGYPVTAAANGARHLPIPSVLLGDYLDVEADGRPHFLALGDDTFPSGLPDDEDGVEFISAFTNVLLQFDPGPPDPVRIPVLAKNRTGRVVFRPSVQGRISGWIDWNRDGDWSDEDETVFRHVQVEAPTDTLSLPVPPTASPGFAYARFRFHPSARLEPTGPIVGGEVEDYLVLVSAPVPVSSTGDTPDASPGDGICADATGACTLRAALMEASAGGGVYVIDLGAAGKTGAAVFRPTSPLPVVRAPVEIVGSQAVLDGSQAGDASGLVFETSGATVYSLTVQGFRRHGLVLAGSENRVWNSRFTGNGEDGIRVASGRLNMLSTNTFSGNGGLAINLVAPSDPANGVTVNDASDTDTGPNDLLNMPVLSLVTAQNGHVRGTTGCASCVVELHANVTCDPSGYGEGDTFLDALATLADGSFDVVLPAALEIGTGVSAILRDRTGNTSEFSACVAAVTTGLDDADARDVPNGYELLQNYPNPFNPTTTIEFRVPEPARVQLVVYDLLGRPVAQLADATLPPGLHSVVFDAGDLPTGYYVYRLHTPSGALARSLVLFK